MDEEYYLGGRKTEGNPGDVNQRERLLTGLGTVTFPVLELPDVSRG